MGAKSSDALSDNPNEIPEAAVEDIDWRFDFEVPLISVQVLSVP